MQKNSSDLKVSIVTVCFNSEKYIERTIRSVIAQTYPNIEYIIIDGGSRDATLKIIEKYRKDIGIFISEPDKGIYDAQNKGIKLTSGNLIGILNSDDRFYDSSVVEKVVSFFKKNNVDFIYGNMLCFNPQNSEVYLKRFPSKLKKRYFLRGPLGHCATFFHRVCFEKSGYYDTSYIISSDYDWYLKALYKNGLRAAHIDATISVFQEGGESSKNRIYLSETESVLNFYFTPFDIFTGRIINFFVYGDLFRLAGLLILRRKGYTHLRSFFRRLLNRRHVYKFVAGRK